MHLNKHKTCWGHPETQKVRPSHHIVFVGIFIQRTIVKIIGLIEKNNWDKLAYYYVQSHFKTRKIATVCFIFTDLWTFTTTSGTYIFIIYFDSRFHFHMCVESWQLVRSYVCENRKHIKLSIKSIAFWKLYKYVSINIIRILLSPNCHQQNTLAIIYNQLTEKNHYVELCPVKHRTWLEYIDTALPETRHVKPMLLLCGTSLADRINQTALS